MNGDGGDVWSRLMDRLDGTRRLENILWLLIGANATCVLFNVAEFLAGLFA